MEVSSAKAYILKRLEKELHSNLSYHSLHHVLDVEQAAIRLADAEGVTDYEKELLLTAVAFHDSGFIYQTKDHEERGCSIVREVLPGFNYTSEEIERICGMIMATKIPQNPHNVLEQIICDADLDYLGRDDFWEIGNHLYQELSVYGILSNEKEWNNLQLKFLNSHHYFTQSAIALRQATKQDHLKKIEAIVQSY
jgi:predicted metal-dependent HD superfamily phosphohydrolase